MPSWELFAAQEAGYREAVLPGCVPTVAVEAGVSLGWSAFADRTVGIDRFAASAPGPEVIERLGISPEGVATAVRDLLAARAAADLPRGDRCAREGGWRSP
jgi:transketolase